MHVGRTLYQTKGVDMRIITASFFITVQHGSYSGIWKLILMGLQPSNQYAYLNSDRIL